ncbi:MAG: M23 family metallopeptidase, partial [Gemmatimonadota bacterium]
MPRMLWSLTALGLAGSSLVAQSLPPLPQADGHKPHVLSLARAPDGAIWVGTYGRGIYVLSQGARTWRHIQDDTTSTSISWGFVHAFAFGSRGEVWYGTLGNGWGLSMDGGRTWANWTFRLLGPEYQYVAPNGIVTRGDTVYVATADGIKVSWDLGRSWREITDSAGAQTAENPWARIGNQYLLSMAVDEQGELWISHVHGVERSSDGGRSWELVVGGESLTGLCGRDQGPSRVRAFAFDPRGRVVWFGTEQGVVTYDVVTSALGNARGSECNQAVQQIEYFGEGAALAATHRGVVIISGQTADANRWLNRGFASAVLTKGTVDPIIGTPTGLATPGPRLVGESLRDSLVASLPSDPKHTWFRRPVGLGEQPYIDQTYRYGSTMGGNFQQHQGIEFNAGAGTPVSAIADGEVVFAGPAEADALTVVIRHDRPLAAEDGTYFVFSTYYHN